MKNLTVEYKYQIKKTGATSLIYTVMGNVSKHDYITNKKDQSRVGKVLQRMKELPQTDLLSS